MYNNLSTAFLCVIKRVLLLTFACGNDKLLITAQPVRYSLGVITAQPLIPAQLFITVLDCFGTFD